MLCCQHSGFSLPNSVFCVLPCPTVLISLLWHMFYPQIDSSLHNSSHHIFSPLSQPYWRRTSKVPPLGPSSPMRFKKEARIEDARNRRTLRESQCFDSTAVPQFSCRWLSLLEDRATALIAFYLFHRFYCSK